MEIFISLLILAIAIYLFIVTRMKINAIKENVIIDDLKKEMEALITEFNRAATRNIEMMEDKIAEIKTAIERANEKIVRLDEKIGRANTPIVVEKLVQDSGRLSKAGPVTEERSARPEKVAETAGEKASGMVKHTRREPPKVIPKQKPEGEETVLPLKEEAAVPLTIETRPLEDIGIAVAMPPQKRRSDELKELIAAGKTREELLQLGYIENEINMLYFLLGKK